MELSQQYWNKRYQENKTGWDLGFASPPLSKIINSLVDRNLKILIPGCGNAYEAELLHQLGFKNITLLDISDILTEALQTKYTHLENIHVVCEDFFNHSKKYDVILEQTFFCALDPNLRKSYISQCANLLRPNGFVTGVLFNRKFDKPGPPFGGDISEYQKLFSNHFTFEAKVAENSIEGRQGYEITFKAILNTYQ